MTEAITIIQTLSSGQRRRLQWEPRADGRWDHHVEKRDGDDWRPVGHKIVDDVAILAGVSR